MKLRTLTSKAMLALAATSLLALGAGLPACSDESAGDTGASYWAEPGSSGGGGGGGGSEYAYGGADSSGSTGEGAGGMADAGSSEGPWEDSGTAADAGGGGEPLPPTQPQAGAMTAGEWRDLDHWGFWRAIFDDPQWAGMEHTWGLDTAGRVLVRVTDGAGAPVIDARVRLVGADEATLFAARTDNYGHAEVFAGLTAPAPAGPLSLEVRAGEAVAWAHDVATSADFGDELAATDVVLAGAASPPATLDLMFVIDTTGSMGDELSFLQTELEDVIGQVAADNGQDLAIRTSVNFYRDHGDSYVVNSHPFTDSTAQVLGQLQAEWAAGGGDFPEAVDEGLLDGVKGHQWRDAARTRLLFLVLDAPPHGGQAERARLHEAALAAAAQGVRIIPLTGSGVDKSTEFLMRELAIATGGSYVFLTDDSGIGGGHIESHVEGPTQTLGDVDIEPLNQLLVRVINDAVAVD